MGCGSSSASKSGADDVHEASKPAKSSKEETKPEKKDPEFENALKKVKKLFEKCDTDKSQEIELAEFVKLTRIPRSIYLDRLLVLFDLDRSGEISFKEFCIGMTIFESKLFQEAGMAEFTFRLFDTDDSGTLSKEELKEAVHLAVTKTHEVSTWKDNEAEIKKKYNRCMKTLGSKYNSDYMKKDEFADLCHEFPQLFAPCHEMWRALSDYARPCRIVCEGMGWKRARGGKVKAANSVRFNYGQVDGDAVWDADEGDYVSPRDGEPSKPPAKKLGKPLSNYGEKMDAQFNDAMLELGAAMGEAHDRQKEKRIEDRRDKHNQKRAEAQREREEMQMQQQSMYMQSQQAHGKQLEPLMPRPSGTRSIQFGNADSSFPQGDIGYTPLGGVVSTIPKGGEGKEGKASKEDEDGPLGKAPRVREHVEIDPFWQIDREEREDALRNGGSSHRGGDDGLSPMDLGDGDGFGQRGDEAATRLQAAERGRQSRKEIKQQHSAATKVQAAERGRQQRREIKQQNEAAVKVQSAERGRQSRKELRKQHDAATEIQKQERGRQARRRTDGKRGGGARLASNH